MAARWSQHFGRRLAQVLRHLCGTDSRAEEIRGCVPKSKKSLTGLKRGRNSLTFLEIERKKRAARWVRHVRARKISERTKKGDKENKMKQYKNRK